MPFWTALGQAAIGAAGPGGGGLSLDTSATSGVGPVSAGPVSVNVAGFGSRAEGSPTSAQTTVPAARGVDLGGGINAGIPSQWAVPLAILGGLALVALIIRR